MGYKMDIPTLSANEVYTLTFEYEGEETIQLTVGNQTLETTDRRVVFTTTSPVNYIESNVKLENLDLYEGYYESDDQDGEYIQESYIEGKSLVNYHDFNRCIFTLNNTTQSKWEFLDDGFARMTTLDISYNHCRPKPTNYTLGNTYTVATWVRNFSSEAGNVMFECFHYLDIIKTIGLDGSITTGNGTGTHYYSKGQEGLMISVGKYANISTKITNGAYHQYMGNFGTSGGFVRGDSVEIFVMVLDGDKADDILNGLIQPFHGIGCVKSPKIVSKEEPNNSDSKYSVVSTPNDLELYGWKNSKGTWVKDKLDLTTGTYYQYYDMWDLGTLLSQTKPQTGFRYWKDTNTVSVQWHLGNTHPSGTVWGESGSALIVDYFEYGYTNSKYETKTSPFMAFFNQYLYFSGMSYSEIFNGVTILDTGDALNGNEAKSALIKFVTDNNLRIGLPLNTPKTEQLDIKPLKSYRNGSITTSSQQLAPTLITTLPVSNKFTQTNLTTGTTYNIHFDGNATSLNCGGTIVDSPTSPCQVKCGDISTLTIDGEVSNVRVLEISVQNEVGSVNYTTDVELSEITSATSTSATTYSENVSDFEFPIKLRSLGNVYDSYNLTTGILTKRIGVSETDGSYKVLSKPIKSEAPAGQPFTNIITSTTFPVTFSTLRDFTGDFKQNTTYTIFLDVATVTGSPQCGVLRDGAYWAGGSPVSYKVGLNKFVLKTDSSSRFALRVRGTSVTLNGLVILEGNYMHFDFIKYFEGTKYIHEIPQLYKDGQIRVYSESDIYPTTILNGQSTNNYVVKHLNTNANYTIRHNGGSESFLFGGTSYTVGSNNLIKSGGLNDNLTFDNGSVENVMVFEGDVTEQDIIHFNGKQTTEIEGVLFQTGYNMFDMDNCETYTGTNAGDVITKEFISALPNEIIHCSYTGGANAYSWLIEYDENKVQTRRTEYSGQGYYRKSVTLLESTQYIKITARNQFKSQVMINRGVDFMPYEKCVSPYKAISVKLAEPLTLNKIHKEKGGGYSFWHNELGQEVEPTTGTVCDSYNPVTGEYIQRVGVYHMCGADSENYIDNSSGTTYCIDDNNLPLPRKKPYNGICEAGLIDVEGIPYPPAYKFNNKEISVTWLNLNAIGINLPREYTGNVFNKNALKQWLKENPITLYYELETPVVTRLEPVHIPTFENAICQVITRGVKIFPMVEYSLPTTNRYSTSMWNVGEPITHRNATEIYINGSTTPTTPTETMTFTEEQLSSGSIVINDNGDGLIVLNGDYTGKDIPYFTGMRSVESIEVEMTGNPNQPVFGKGGRR